MRDLMANLTARHFIVLSLAMMLILGGVTSALAGRDDEPARRENDSVAGEADAIDNDDDDDTNGDTRLSRVSGAGFTALTDNDGTDTDGIDTTGNEAAAAAAAAAAQTDNDGTDTDGYDTTGVAAANWTDNDGTDSDGVDTGGVGAGSVSASGDDS